MRERMCALLVASVFLAGSLYGADRFMSGFIKSVPFSGIYIFSDCSKLPISESESKTWLDLAQTFDAKINRCPGLNYTRDLFENSKMSMEQCHGSHKAMISTVKEKIKMYPNSFSKYEVKKIAGVDFHIFIFRQPTVEGENAEKDHCSPVKSNFF